MDNPHRRACIVAEDFAAFISGALDEPARQSVELHVDACVECRTLLSALAKAIEGVSGANDRSRPFNSSLPPGSGAVPLVRGVELAPGARFGRYVVTERLGAGAMGVVYAAHDPRLDRRIALKVLRAEVVDPAQRESLRDRLRREAQSMARLAHPNVVAVHDVGEVDGHVGLAMELVTGQTLTEWLAGARRSLGDVLGVFIEAGRGLAAAHAAGLVHRDFKPDNVLVGSDGRVRVGDFGLAHRHAEPLRGAAPDGAPAAARPKATHDLAGTPYYMAPEQLLGRPTDARADQFSFCVALYAALTGAHPFGPSPLADLIAGAGSGKPRAVARRDGLPRWLYRVLRRGLAIEPAERHPSMTALLAQLSRHRQRGLWRGGAVVACTALVLGGAFAWRAHLARVRCRGFAQRLDGVWDEPRQLAMGRAFRASGHRRWSVLFHEAEQRLNRYANEWVTLRTEACEAGLTGRDPKQLERRVQCLDARLHNLGYSAARLTHVDGNDVAEISAEVPEVGNLAVCLDDDALSRMARPDVATLPAPALVVDGRGDTVYVVRKADGTLWRGWRGAVAAWREAQIAGGVSGDPALILDRDGRLSYFVRKSDGWLWRGREALDGRGAWQETRVAEGVSGKPALIVGGDGGLGYFVRKTDGTLWHGTSAGDGWRERAIATGIAGDPGACLDRDGKPTYFVRRSDGSLWRGWPGEAAWQEEPIEDALAGEPVVALDLAGKLTSYQRMLDGTLRVVYQIEAGSRSWGYAPMANGIAGNPTLSEDAERTQHCWARTVDGALWHGWQDRPGAGPWHSEIAARGVASDPGAVRAGDGRQVYVVGLADGSLRRDVTR